MNENYDDDKRNEVDEERKKSLHAQFVSVNNAGWSARLKVFQVKIRPYGCFRSNGYGNSSTCVVFARHVQLLRGLSTILPINPNIQGIETNLRYSYGNNLMEKCSITF